MNVLNLIPNMHSNLMGPEYVVLQFAKILKENFNTDVKILCMKGKEDFSDDNIISFQPSILLKNTIGFSLDALKFIDKVNQEKRCIFHSHGLWRFINISPVLLKKDNSKPMMVVSPHGALSEEALIVSKLKKRLLWSIQQFALKQADCFHATSMKEYHEIRRLGFKQPVAIIPPGISIPQLEQQQHSDRKKALYLGRIHPIKGIDNLLIAWKNLQSTNQNWDLHIVGPDQSQYAKYLKRMKKDLKLSSVYFEGEVFGEDKNIWFQKSDLFILPSHSENFGIAVAESLSNATPVIVTNKTPWEIVEEFNCGWYIDDSVEGIENAMRNAFVSESLHHMGMKGRRLMELSYSWESVGYKMYLLYNWLYNQEKRHDFIIEK
jgi:glycosyltransferase involved in cell wall biosynthesis